MERFLTRALRAALCVTAWAIQEAAERHSTDLRDRVFDISIVVLAVHGVFLGISHDFLALVTLLLQWTPLCLRLSCPGFSFLCK